MSEVGGISVASRGVGSPVLSSDTPTPRFCFKNEEDILYLKWKCHLHLNVRFTFFRESLRHLKLFSVIVHELIELSPAKLTEILTRQKTLEQPSVFQLMFQRRLLPVHQLSLRQLCVHHPCGPRYYFSSRNPWRKRRSRVGTSMFNKC